MVFWNVRKHSLCGGQINKISQKHMSRRHPGLWGAGGVQSFTNTQAQEVVDKTVPDEISSSKRLETTPVSLWLAE